MRILFKAVGDFHRFHMSSPGVIQSHPDSSQYSSLVTAEFLYPQLEGPKKELQQGFLTSRWNIFIFLDDFPCFPYTFHFSIGNYSRLSPIYLSSLMIFQFEKTMDFPIFSHTHLSFPIKLFHNFTTVVWSILVSPFFPTRRHHPRCDASRDVATWS